MENIDSLHWPLSVLSRAVHFKNLTSASAHVGLSQPQLSRIVSQLESELNVTLLDRSARRKSGWTPTAHQLADIYSKNSRRLQEALSESLEAQIPQQVNVGTLEGLGFIGLNLSQLLFKKTKVRQVELNIYDQDGLEKRFLNGDLDLIISSRSPGKQKYKHYLELGFQHFDTINSQANLLVLSPHEYSSKKNETDSEGQIFISNSLALRKSWLQKFGGTGALPASVQAKKSAHAEHPVLMIGAELFHESLWKTLNDQKSALIES